MVAKSMGRIVTVRTSLNSGVGAEKMMQLNLQGSGVMVSMPVLVLEFMVGAPVGWLR